MCTAAVSQNIRESCLAPYFSTQEIPEQRVWPIYKVSDFGQEVLVVLRSSDGKKVYAAASFGVNGTDWTRYEATLKVALCGTFGCIETIPAHGRKLHKIKGE